MRVHTGEHILQAKTEYNTLRSRVFKIWLFFYGKDKNMDKEKIAIERLKTAAEMSLATYQQPLIITYSGGKDNGK